MSTSSKYLTIAEVAESLEIHKMSVHRLIESGQLEAYKFGGQFRIERAELAAFIDRSRIAATS